MTKPIGPWPDSWCDPVHEADGRNDKFGSRSQRGIEILKEELDSLVFKDGIAVAKDDVTATELVPDVVKKARSWVGIHRRRMGGLASSGGRFLLHLAGRGKQPARSPGVPTGLPPPHRRREQQETPRGRGSSPRLGGRCSLGRSAAARRARNRARRQPAALAPAVRGARASRGTRWLGHGHNNCVG